MSRGNSTGKDKSRGIAVAGWLYGTAETAGGVGIGNFGWVCALKRALQRASVIEEQKQALAGRPISLRLSADVAAIRNLPSPKVRRGFN